MIKMSDKQWPLVIIFLFTMAIYGNSLMNDYALDDLMVIKQNSFTQKGISGIPDIFRYDSFTGFWGKEKKLVAGGRYRPFSLATFAIEKTIMGGFNPVVSHLINILLYALTGMLIFQLLSKLLKAPKNREWHLGIPFMAAMLFVAHPVHTEVVANIKGRDEIFALLFSLITLRLMVDYAGKPKFILLILANLSFFTGLLSKENTIMFVILVPVTLYFYTKLTLGRNLLLSATLLFTAALFVFIRFLVLGQVISTSIPGELLNNPFLEATTSQKFGTIFYTLGLYIKLLLFPHPLTHDYYPYHIPLIPLADLRAVIPFILYLFLIIYALVKFRQKSTVAYGIMLYLMPLIIVSNLLFPVGTFMNERFIYMSSLGFVVIAAFLISDKTSLLIASKVRSRQVILSVFITMLMLCSVKTYTRNKVWKDDFTLFTTDVNVSENSIKCNISAGGDYLKKATLETDSVKKEASFRLSLKYLEKALGLAPNSINALVLYGNLNALYLKDYKTSINQYLKVLSMNPDDNTAMKNALRVLETTDSQKEYRFKINTYLLLNKSDTGNAEIYYNLGRLYGQYAGNLDSAALCLENAIRLAPGQMHAYKDLGIIYSLRKEYNRAIDIFRTASRLDPSDVQVKQNLELTCRIMKQEKK